MATRKLSDPSLSERTRARITRGTRKFVLDAITSGMRQAIVTRYVGPTDHRGSRVSVRADAARMFAEWDDSLNVQENHAIAALQLAGRLGWIERNTLVGGSLPGNDGYCFVLVPRRTRKPPR